jgi:hypothetical protein
MLEKRTEVPEELEVIIEKTTLVVEEMLELFPDVEPGWDRSHLVAQTAVNYLDSVSAAYFNLKLQGKPNHYPLAAHIVTSPVRAWVTVDWKGQVFFVDFSDDKTVITDASDPQYIEMLHEKWVEE